MVGFIGDLQPARARKRFEQRRDIIAKFAVADSALLQNVPGQNVKIKLRRDPQVPAIIQDCIDQSRTIENGITCFDIAQKIDERNLIGLRARKSAHDEVEISSGKPRPTIRSNHRDFIMRDLRAMASKIAQRRSAPLEHTHPACRVLENRHAQFALRLRNEWPLGRTRRAGARHQRSLA